MFQYVLSFIILLTCCEVYCQSDEEFDFFENKVISQTPKQKIFEDNNAIEVTTDLLFKVYSNLISSQDGSTCSFYPTCSAYCRHSISKYGLLKGGIKTFDRLTRCNGFSPERYTIDIERRKLVDHVH